MDSAAAPAAPAASAAVFNRSRMDGRERIAELLDGVVSQARALLDRGGLPPDEISNALRFYVLAAHLLSSARDPAQPLHPTALAGALRQLEARCSGTLADQRRRVQAALEEAENVDWDYRTA